MKKLLINFIGVDPILPDLNLGKAENKSPDLNIGKVEPKPQVLIEEHALTNETPRAGRKVEIDEDVLELLKDLAKGRKEGKTSVDVNERLALALDKLAEASMQSTDNAAGRFMGARPVDSYTIDKDDVMDGVAIFFAKSAAYALYDDVRNGHTIRTPYGRSFKFKLLIRQVDKTSARNPVYLSLSALQVRSKKEYEWLKAHTLFGIKFYEQKDGGKEISEDLQDLIVKAWQITSQMDDHTVMQRCNGENIDIDTSDISKLRKKLAFKIATNMSRDADKIRSKPVQDLDDKVNNRIKNADEQNFANPVSTY